jgi:hypothetical protein
MSPQKFIKPLATLILALDLTINVNIISIHLVRQFL